MACGLGLDACCQPRGTRIATASTLENGDRHEFQDRTRSCIPFNRRLCFDGWRSPLHSRPDEQGPAWVNGGIGEAEQRALKQAAGNYSLGLTFASFSGAYLANADVQVKNAGGEVVCSGTSLDPILLVDLPAGQYIVEATYEGNRSPMRSTWALRRRAA